VEVVAVDFEEMPMAELIWLEAKTVCRGGDSLFFPDLTLERATAIRMMGLDQLRESLKKVEKEGE
jgi:hypothetical protein